MTLHGIVLGSLLGAFSVACSNSAKSSGQAPIASQSPGSPNTHAEPESEDSLSVPKLSLSVANVPVKESDLERLSLDITADSAFSHYAYKIGMAKDCYIPGGYFVSDINRPILINQGILPFGPVYLCLIGFHKDLSRWERVADAKVYSWQKVPFRRSFKGYYEFTSSPDQCPQPTIIRVNTTLNIDGDKGNYAFSVVIPAGCTANSGTGARTVVSIKTTESKMIGTLIDTGDVGWFDLNFTNPERTAFTGTWGLGSHGVNPLGVWNSEP